MRGAARSSFLARRHASIAWRQPSPSRPVLRLTPLTTSTSHSVRWLAASPLSAASSRQFSAHSQHSAIPANAATSADHDTANIIPLRKQLKDAKKAAKRSNGHRQGANTDLKDWELTVGIEVHAQLNTDTKLFSAASNNIDDAPNTNVALFDLAMPGSQPIFQRPTLLPALRAAIAFGCDIQRISHFDRKHYFYQDQPCGYQITQYYEPYALNGQIWLGPHDGIAKEDGNGVLVGLKQIQMEQDTAKSTETPSGAHLLDFNRVSRPLIEIITLPQIHSPETAAACIKKIQATLQSVGAVTTGMEMGGLRADVNVSVRRTHAPAGDQAYHGISGLGQRTEIKNLSSFKAVEDAVRAEMLRQISVLEAGGVIEGETRRWTIGQTETKKLRGKEGEVDYRYMPDPDLGPVIISEELLNELKRRMPQLPDAQLEMLTKDPRYGLSAVDAKTLIELDDGSRLEYYHDVVDAYEQIQASDASPSVPPDPKLGRIIANWVLHEIGGLFSRASELDPELVWSSTQVPAQKLAEIIHLQQTRQATSSSSKQLLSMVFNGDERAIATIVENEGMKLTPMTKEEYVALAQEIMSANPDAVKQIKEKQQHGKIGFLVGQIVRKGEKGRVEAQRADAVLKELLLGSQ